MDECGQYWHYCSSILQEKRFTKRNLRMENEEVAEELIDDEMKGNSEEIKTNLDENGSEDNTSNIK